MFARGGPSLKQIEPIHIFNLHFNIIFLPTFRRPKILLISTLSDNIVCVLFTYHSKRTTFPAMF